MLGGERKCEAGRKMKVGSRWVGVGTGNYDNEKRGETHIKFGDKGLMVYLSATSCVITLEDLAIVVNLSHNLPESMVRSAPRR